MWQTYTHRTPIDDKLFSEAYALLCSALPPEETRTLEDQKALLNDSAYQLRLLRDDTGTVIAFLAVWEWPDLRYLEHFAVKECLRGRGLGADTFNAYFHEDSRPFVLEVEPEDASPMAKRRIGFYKRLGLSLNDYAYLQPALRKELSAVPLKLMTWPGPVDKAGFEHLRRCLHSRVYHIE